MLKVYRESKERRTCKEIIRGIKGTHERQFQYENQEKVTEGISNFIANMPDAECRGLQMAGCEAWTIGKDATRRINDNDKG